MRAIVVLLLLAAAFGAAAVWQSHRVRELHRERDEAIRAQQGELVQSESGPIEAGWAVVTVGRPSGVAPLEGVREEDEAPPAPVEAPPIIATPLDATPSANSVLLGDFEKLVEPGETLSRIAKAHYGTAAHDVVSALARYNGLADENALQSGAKLRLPPLDQLAR